MHYDLSFLQLRKFIIQACNKCINIHTTNKSLYPRPGKGEITRDWKNSSMAFKAAPITD